MKWLVRWAVFSAGMFLMSGLYLFIKHMIIGISADFGDGFFVGFLTMYFLMLAAWKFAPESFYRPFRGFDALDDGKNDVP